MKLIGLAIIIGVLAGLAGAYLTDRSSRWVAGSVYTVAPKTTTAELAYKDIQASNLFIDVIRSWLIDPAIQQEIESQYPGTQLSSPLRLSMQTFNLRTTVSKLEWAEPSLLLADRKLTEALERYNQSGEMTKYSAWHGPITVSTLPIRPAVNGLMAGLITLLSIVGLGLLINYYHQTYAHRR